MSLANPVVQLLEELSQEVAHCLNRAWDTKGSHSAQWSHVTNSLGSGKKPIL